jgi:hypothetical protein
MFDPGRLHILVDGQTEATVVRDVLEPYLRTHHGIVTYSIVSTGPRTTHRGGVTSWAKIERDIRALLGRTNLRVLTTLFDYYGFPKDAPGMGDRPSGKPRDRVRHVEQALRENVGDRRFQPHLVLHELESWVFGAASQLGN